MLNPVLFFDGCAVSVVKYLPAGAQKVPKGGDAVLCSLPSLAGYWIEKILIFCLEGGTYSGI